MDQVRVEFVQSPHRSRAYLPDGIVLGDSHYGEGCSRILPPSRNKTIDGLEAHAPIVVGDAVEKIIHGMEGLSPCTRTRPGRSLGRESRIILVDDRDVLDRSDRELVGQVFRREMLHVSNGAASSRPTQRLREGVVPSSEYAAA